MAGIPMYNYLVVFCEDTSRIATTECTYERGELLIQLAFVCTYLSYWIETLMYLDYSSPPTGIPELNFVVGRFREESSDYWGIKRLSYQQFVELNE